MAYEIGETRTELLLPDPVAREVKYTVISVDDHLVEPPDMFEGRLPAALQEHAPRIIENDRGHQIWSFDGRTFTQVGMNAVAGRKREFVTLEPTRFEDMRPGCWDIDERIKDMDIGGIWASMNFPSQVTGFCGRVFSTASDPEVGMAATRAWNDWLIEEWHSPYPDRIIPLGITYLADPEEGAREIHRMADLGFVSVTLPERPHRIGFPALWDTDHWDPIIRACADTDMVISLHVGSSGMHDMPPGAPALELGATLFGSLSLTACAEWLWSGFPGRYPDLKIAMSEGGIGWVPMLLDRLDNIVERSGYGTNGFGGMRPADVLQRNFWFCTIDDPSTIDCRDRIGLENIMVEVDYPHGDSTWPDTQLVLEKAWGHLPPNELRMLCSENAAGLYRHPLPPVVLPLDREGR